MKNPRACVRRFALKCVLWDFFGPNCQIAAFENLFVLADFCEIGKVELLRRFLAEITSVKIGNFMKF